jgi:secreted trypsin-like serine protease
MSGHLRSLVVAVLGAVICASVAIAITYGQPDGNGHPNVGALVAEWVKPGEKDIVCSGTLIAPTVFLTAGHCVAYLEQQGISSVWVTFDTQFTQSSALIAGTMHRHPGYNWRMSDPKDIAVVVLASALGITPATLPTEGLFDQLAKSHALKGQQFVAVGYGGLEPRIGGGPPRWEYPDVRMFATSTFDALNNAWLRLSQNPATGDGGACYGDSGGPNFLGTSPMIAAITVTGDAMCRATNVVYRLDTPSAREFLGHYVTLP